MKTHILHKISAISTAIVALICAVVLFTCDAPIEQGQVYLRNANDICISNQIDYDAYIIRSSFNLNDNCSNCSRYEYQLPDATNPVIFPKQQSKDKATSQLPPPKV